jgi:hypothetical protein
MVDQRIPWDLCSRMARVALVHLDAVDHRRAVRALLTPS